MKASDEVRTVDVCWVDVRVLGRDKLADTDAVIDHNQPVASFNASNTASSSNVAVIGGRLRGKNSDHLEAYKS